MSQSTREAELRKRYEELSNVYWQHSIQLLPDLLAKGGKSVESLELERSILIDPLDFRGRSVIEIGSWTGYHAFEAKRAGAARVIATDKFAWNEPAWRGRETFELARDCLQLDVEMVEVDPTELPGTLQPADVVLFLGVFYHMYQPVTILEKVCALARDAIVIETQQDLLTLNRPGMAFYPRDVLQGDSTNWWGPNPECMVELLETCGFTEVFYQERFAGGRGNFHAFRSKQLATSYMRREADNVSLFDLRSQAGRKAIYGDQSMPPVRQPAVSEPEHPTVQQLKILSDQHKQFRDETAAANAARKTAEREVANLKMRLEEHQTALRQAQAERAALLESTSWRVTAPLRALRSTFGG